MVCRAKGNHMNDIQQETGPIDYIVVEWPPGSPPNGKGFPLLVDLVDRGIIRILDLLFVQTDVEGNAVAVDIVDLDLDGNPDLAVFVGVSSGLLDDDDVAEAGRVLEPGAAGAILVYENTWAAPFATALRTAGARLIDYGRIPVNELISTLDELESAES
ncbi:MAG TPA: DUF6325 family protein [Acidimicrobiia bacterium]